MLPRLRLRKTCRKLIFDRKGFSSIVGAVFAVLVMVSLVSTVFVWSLSQNTLYNNSVRQSNLADLDRSNERIVTNVTCSRVDDNWVSVNGTLENDGPLSVHIVTLWVANANKTNYAYRTPVNITLSPGNMTTLSGSTAINVTLPNSAGDILSCWFISERGNTVSEKSNMTINNYSNGTANPNSTWALISQGIGAFAFDFTSFKYYNVTIGTPDRFVYSSGKNSYTVPWGGYIAFSFKLTNLYPNLQNITLDGRSVMWSYFPSSPGQANGPLWYIANVDTTAGTISPAYSPITLPFNMTTEVFFAKQAASWDNQQKNQLGAINLLMYGIFGTGPTAYEYAQNIPFVSLNARF